MRYCIIWYRSNTPRVFCLNTLQEVKSLVEKSICRSEEIELYELPDDIPYGSDTCAEIPHVKKYNDVIHMRRQLDFETISHGIVTVSIGLVDNPNIKNSISIILSNAAT